MQTEKEKPNAKTAWSFTVSAICLHLCFGCYAALESELQLLLLVSSAVAAAGNACYAVSEWKKYFEAYTRHEIQSQSKDSAGHSADASPAS